ncbi:hypothetical protein GMA8713_03726 [Grimontia marina]|uniref:Uncharacterized protein n=1 Tax=Grimontia marina TaxID=646534 RepID=A0A128FFY2_9GAMM|nr:hypothetical protein GMA8713_03726 [Grimontia marina]
MRGQNSKSANVKTRGKPASILAYQRWFFSFIALQKNDLYQPLIKHISALVRNTGMAYLLSPLPQHIL